MNQVQTSSIVQILIASTLLESVWEIISLLIDKRDRPNLKTRIGTIAVGLFLSFSYNLDILSYLGLHDHIPYSGVFLTGILISRGSNFIHDLLTRLSTWRQTLAVLTPVTNPGIISSASSTGITPVIKDDTASTTTTSTTTTKVESSQDDKGTV